MLSSRALIAVALAPFGVAWSVAADAQAPLCRQGFVWRNAFDGDAVCVPPATRSQAADDNAQAAARRSPGGGPYGPATCQPGFVWRAARPSDLVCVSPATRDQVARDNAAASSRVASAAPRPLPPPAAGGYRYGDWSQWMRISNSTARYRFRWGLNPAAASSVDALFEVANNDDKPWRGNVRSIVCNGVVLSDDKSVTVGPRQTAGVSFKTPNCGTAAQPFFKGSATMSYSY